ncbi:MAG: hypothetical protein ACXWUG_31535 [Polyangiales bacterium]
MSLAPCPSCRRHVRVGEQRCPFCTASLPKLVARNLELPRMSRAALVAAVVAATGCREQTPVVTADPPAKTADDAGPARDATQGTTDPVPIATVDAADADDAVHLYHPPVAKYGAPPHPHPTSHPKYGAPPPPEEF